MAETFGAVHNATEPGRIAAPGTVKNKSTKLSVLQNMHLLGRSIHFAIKMIRRFSRTAVNLHLAGSSAARILETATCCKAGISNS